MKQPAHVVCYLSKLKKAKGRDLQIRRRRPYFYIGKPGLKLPGSLNCSIFRVGLHSGCDLGNFGHFAVLNRFAFLKFGDSSQNRHAQIGFQLVHVFKGRI